jgi:hypothetical protein
MEQISNARQVKIKEDASSSVAKRRALKLRFALGTVTLLCPQFARFELALNIA